MMNCSHSKLPLIGKRITQGWVCGDLWAITFSWFSYTSGAIALHILS